jgi:2'-5' RNA ligase
MRVFVALDIPESVRAAAADLSARLQKICPQARWVRLQGVHVTLKFIGEAPEAQVERIRAALADVRGFGSIEIRFAGLGFFPSGRHPRVFWAGMEAGAVLGQLAAAIEAKLAPLGIPSETRDFHPHLTLARFDSPEGVERLRAEIDKLGNPEFGSTATTEFHLYRSVLKSGGAEYTRLETYRLAGEQAP